MDSSTNSPMAPNRLCGTSSILKSSPCLMNIMYFIVVLLFVRVVKKGFHVHVERPLAKSTGRFQLQFSLTPATMTRLAYLSLLALPLAASVSAQPQPAPGPIRGPYQ